MTWKWTKITKTDNIEQFVVLKHYFALTGQKYIYGKVRTSQGIQRGCNGGLFWNKKQKTWGLIYVLLIRCVSNQIL